jgi:hypothetical protein
MATRLLLCFCLFLCFPYSQSKEQQLAGGGYRVAAVKVDRGGRRLRAEAVATAAGASTGDVQRLDVYARCVRFSELFFYGAKELPQSIN